MKPSKCDDLNEMFSHLCGEIMEGGVSRLCDKMYADIGTDSVLCEYGDAVNGFAMSYMKGEDISIELLNTTRFMVSSFLDRYEIEDHEYIIEEIDKLLNNEE